MPTRLSSLHLVLLFTSLLALAAGFWLIATGPGSLPQFIPFRKPTSAVVDQRGRLYVVDVGGTRLTALGRDGSFRWSRVASPGDRGFAVVRTLAVDTDDRLYLVDSVRNRVVRLSSRGEFDRVYSPPPTGRVFAFDAFDSGWMVSDHRLYLEVQRLGALGSSVVRLPPVTPPALGAVGPRGEVSWVDTQGRLWGLEDREWRPLKVPQVSRVSGLRYLSDGRLLILDHPSQTWFAWKNGHTETLLAPLATQPTWSPEASLAADGTLVVAQPFADRVFLNNWGRTEVAGTRVGGWTRAFLVAPWVLVALGFLGTLVALVLVFRAVARRNLDLQIVQVTLLVPLVVTFVAWTLADVQRRVDDQVEGQKLASLEAIVRVLVPELVAHPDDLEKLATEGVQAGALGYLSLIESSPRGHRIAQAFPHPWIQGFETGVPAGAVDLAPGQAHSEVYDGLWSRRHAAFARLGPDRLVEVGVESALTPGPTSRLSGLLWVGLSVVLVLGTGAYSLAKVAPRYALGRSLLAPIPPTGFSPPRGSRGVAIALRWCAEPRRSVHPLWVTTVPDLMRRCRRGGARVATLNAQGALLLLPATLAQALEWARSLSALRPRCLVLVEGSWDYARVPRLDRHDDVAVGEAPETAWALASGEPADLGGLFVAGAAVGALEVPWRGVSPEGPVVQVLDPARPSDRAAIDYVAGHNEAFRAWAEGHLDEALRGFTFLAGRLPEDRVLRALVKRLTP